MLRATEPIFTYPVDKETTLVAVKNLTVGTGTNAKLTKGKLNYYINYSYWGTLINPGAYEVIGKLSEVTEQQASDWGFGSKNNSWSAKYHLKELIELKLVNTAVLHNENNLDNLLLITVKEK